MIISFHKNFKKKYNKLQKKEKEILEAYESGEHMPVPNLEEEKECLKRSARAILCKN